MTSALSSRVTAAEMLELAQSLESERSPHHYVNRAAAVLRSIAAPLLQRRAQADSSIAAAKDAGVAGRAGDPKPLPPAVATILEGIAGRHLHIPTLQPRGLDRLDFHDLGVGGVKSALEAAYRAGLAARCDARALPEPPLIGRWHHGQGYLVSGSIRISRWDCDTNPPIEFRDNLLDWMCGTLNAAVQEWEKAAPDQFADEASRT